MELNGIFDEQRFDITVADEGKAYSEGFDDGVKFILQHFMGLPTCQHPTIGTGNFMFGKWYIKELANKYGVKLDE